LRKTEVRSIGGGAGRGSVYVDTSAWIAFFSARDQNHADAERLFREAIDRKVRLITTNLVLAEIHRLILHRAGADAARFALDRIESGALVTIEFATGTHHVAARSWLDKLKGHPVTYADAVGLAVIEDFRCTGYLSFDSDFLRAGFRPWAPR
jgi:predicted nucleic acid-binding protein